MEENVNEQKLLKTIDTLRKDLEAVETAYKVLGREFTEYKSRYSLIHPNITDLTTYVDTLDVTLRALNATHSLVAHNNEVLVLENMRLKSQNAFLRSRSFWQRITNKTIKCAHN